MENANFLLYGAVEAGLFSCLFDHEVSVFTVVVSGNSHPLSIHSCLNLS